MSSKIRSSVVWSSIERSLLKRFSVIFCIFFSFISFIKAPFCYCILLWLFYYVLERFIAVFWGLCAIIYYSIRLILDLLISLVWLGLVSLVQIWPANCVLWLFRPVKVTSRLVAPFLCYYVLYILTVGVYLNFCI